jgi:UDP-N-acetylmuramate dehydrogenase
MKNNELTKNFPKIKVDEDLKKHCTFMIGGPADYFYECRDSDELPKIIKAAKILKIPFFIFGAGSNILFDDKGFRGLIIKMESKKIEVKEDFIKADAGVMISQLIKESLKNRLSGLEKWAGLPGTVGGAVRGNAGCNGLETNDILVRATVFNPESEEIKEIKVKDLNYSYRKSSLKETEEIVLNATFKLKEAEISEEEQENLMKEVNKKRLGKQPFGKTTGSFFKNPSPENPAGMLIEKAELKGKTIGKAQISEKHANFFLNLGGASSCDIIKLAKLAKSQVEAEFGILLEEEVQILSEHGKIKL